MVEDSLEQKKNLVKCPECPKKIQIQLISKASGPLWGKYASMVDALSFGIPI